MHADKPEEVGDSGTVLQTTVGGLDGLAEDVKHTRENSNAHRSNTGRASMYHDDAQRRALTLQVKGRVSEEHGIYGER
jgi:hypothetical protein